MTSYLHARDVWGDESEKQFMQRVKRRAEVHGWMVWHQLDSIGTRSGLPDLIMVRPPRLVFAELKSAHGRLSPAQREAIARLLDCPQVEAYVWYPRDDAVISKVLT